MILARSPFRIPVSRMPAFAAVVALASVSATSRGDDAPSAVDFNDVAPIVYAKCADCHRPGQIGPMSLLSYDEIRPWAKSIRAAVSGRTMPPWHADPAYGSFKLDRSLPEAEIETIVKWIDSGAPRGDAASAPAPPQFDDEGWMMGEPDQVFEMTEEFVVGDDVEDHYAGFVIPSDLPEDKWVVATELKAGAPEVVHHILVFVAKAGVVSEEEIKAAMETSESEGDLDPRVFSGGLFAKYAPGANPEIWPEGYGRKLPAGSLIVFQNHYHKEPGPGTARADRSKLAVRYADAPIENPITTAWLANFALKIEPGQKDARASSIFKFIDDGEIHALAPHLHLRGKDFVFEAEYPDGSKEILLNVPRYDFNWQTSYIFREPKQVPKGTTIRAIGRWDNSADNPHNPDPTKTVYWGNASTDEMMIGFMDYTYNTKKRFQSMFGTPEGVDFDPFGFGGGGGAGAGGE